MRVLVLADAKQKEELLSIPVDPSLDLTWIDSMEMKIPSNFDACIDLLFDETIEGSGNNTTKAATQRVEWLSQLNCPLIVINAMTTTLQGFPGFFVRVNAWPGFLGRNIAELSLNESDELLKLKQIAENLFALLGRRVSWVPDIKGFISARVLATVINEAFYTLGEEISTKNEIDIAMKLGTNYPYGPFEWGEKIGLSKIYSLLALLSVDNARYQPSSFLKHSALA